MKHCFITVTVIAVMIFSLTACKDNDTSSNAVSSSTTSSSTISSSSTPSSTPEPEMRSYIKQKIDTWYSKHTVAQSENNRVNAKYGDVSKIPDSEVMKALAEFEAVKNKLEEAQALLEEIMDMKDLMNQTEIDYLGAILEKANG